MTAIIEDPKVREVRIKELTKQKEAKIHAARTVRNEEMKVAHDTAAAGRKVVADKFQADIKAAEGRYIAAKAKINAEFQTAVETPPEPPASEPTPSAAEIPAEPATSAPEIPAEVPPTSEAPAPAEKPTE